MSLPSSFKPVGDPKSRVEWVNSDGTTDVSEPIDGNVPLPPPAPTGLPSSFKPVPMGTESNPSPGQDLSSSDSTPPPSPGFGAAPAPEKKMGVGQMLVKAAQTGFHNFGDELGASAQSSMQFAQQFPKAVYNSVTQRDWSPIDNALSSMDDTYRKALYENLSESAKAQRDYPVPYAIASGVASAPVSAAESMVAPETKLLPAAQGFASGWGGSAGEPPMDRVYQALKGGGSGLALSFIPGLNKIPGLQNAGPKTKGAVAGGVAGLANSAINGTDMLPSVLGGAAAGFSTAGLANAPVNAKGKATGLVDAEQARLAEPINAQNEKAQGDYQGQLDKIKASMAKQFHGEQDQVAKSNQAASDEISGIKDDLAKQHQSKIDTSTKESAALRKQLYDSYQKTAMRLGLTGDEISNMDPQKVLEAALNKAQASSDSKWAREVQTIQSRLHNDKAAGYELDPQAMSAEGYSLPEKADLIQRKHADLTAPRLAEVPLSPPTVLPEDVKLPLTQSDQASLGLQGRPAPTKAELDAMQAHETAQRAALGVVPPAAPPPPLTKEGLSAKLSDFLANRTALGQDVPQFQYGPQEQLSPGRLQSIADAETARQKGLGLLSEPVPQSTDGLRDLAVKNLQNGPGIGKTVVGAARNAILPMLGIHTIGTWGSSPGLAATANALTGGLAIKSQYQQSPSAQYSFNNSLGKLAPAGQMANKAAPMVMAPAITNWLTNRKKQQDLDALYGQLSAKYKVQSSSTVTSDEASDNFSKMALQGMRQSVNGAK